MEDASQILENIREEVGCNGVRHFSDFAKLKQPTVERKLMLAYQRRDKKLNSCISIYCIWLADQVQRIGGYDRFTTVVSFCEFLVSMSCPKDKVINCWKDCMMYTLSQAGKTGGDELVSFAHRRLEPVLEEIGK